jgi:STE24 endopeptidase
MPEFNVYLAVVLAALLLSHLLDWVSGLLNLKALDPELPREFQGVYDPEQYRRSQEYTRANTRLGLASGAWHTGLLLLFLFLGGFNALDQTVRALEWHPVAAGLVYLGALALLSDLAGLPFSIYHTFVQEERFGFNRTTPGTFVADTLKGWALSALIGGPLLAGVLWFFRTWPEQGWLMAWGLAALVVAALQYLAPRFILPLFNKFQPLEEGELRSDLERYAQSQGYELSGIYVMDGSKRTAKGNAFFTGFGKQKRIALFDTLLERMARDEIVAVLAHEVGHYKKKHTLQGMALGIAKLGVVLWLLSLFLDHQGLFAAFGVQEQSVYAGLVFFMLLYAPVSMALSLAVHALSRRWEYQADAFAARTTDAPRAMANALKKLSAQNLSNLTPHPLHVALNYSHPPVLERVRALKQS